MSSAKEEFIAEVERIFQPGFVYKGWSPNPNLHFFDLYTGLLVECVGETTIWMVLEKPIIKQGTYMVIVLTPYGNRSLQMAIAAADKWNPDLKQIKRIWPK